MNHDQRARLAREICDRLAARHGEQILVGGLYGSTARGTDTPWSDLEMTFGVTDDCPVEGQHFLFQGTAVGYRVYRRGALEALLAQPSLQWPFHMGMLDVLQVIHGDPRWVANWLAIGRAVPRDRFISALETHLPGVVVEAHGRLHSSLQRGECEALRPAALELLFEIKTALCLLNQSWTTHDYYQGLVDSFIFPRLPQGYRELVPALYQASDPGELVALADRLVEGFWRLIAAEGVRVREYTTLTDIPV